MKGPEAGAWDQFAEQFDDRVFSFTKFPHHRKKILEAIPGGTVLNMGTGSAPYLNQDLVQSGHTVIATDFSDEMLSRANKQFNAPQLYYVKADSRSLLFEDQTFQSVVAINSILPPRREEVVTMLAQAFRVLKLGGKFVGVFPSYEWHIRAGTIIVDDEQKRVQDTVGWQTCQTRETLEQHLRSAGFQSWNIEEVFLNTEEEIEELKKLYNVDARKLKISEYFVTAVK